MRRMLSATHATTRPLTRLIAVALLALFAATPQAQTVHPSVPDADLPAILRALDKQHFDAFNTCDLDTLAALYAPDVEFYHDLNGRIMNREQFLGAVKRAICGKVQRRLDEASLQAFPMAKVGALQIGAHCFLEVGKADCIQSGRFFIYWRYDGSRWQIARVYSYDHQDIKKP